MHTFKTHLFVFTQPYAYGRIHHVTMYFKL